LDSNDFPEELLIGVHRDLDRIHRFLGNFGALVTALGRDPLPIRKVLDVGCGHGGSLRHIQAKLSVDVVGVDLRPPKNPAVNFPILPVDAIKDPLPAADVAVSVCFAHHLSEDELIEVIRNVGRSCRRFIILDLVRSRLPLALFRTFIAPFVLPVNGKDGCQSIRRAFQPRELSRVVASALRGTSGTFMHSVSRFSIRQIIDISY